MAKVGDIVEYWPDSTDLLSQTNVNTGIHSEKDRLGNDILVIEEAQADAEQYGIPAVVTHAYNGDSVDLLVFARDGVVSRTVVHSQEHTFSDDNGTQSHFTEKGAHANGSNNPSSSGSNLASGQSNKNKSAGGSSGLPGESGSSVSEGSSF